MKVLKDLFAGLRDFEIYAYVLRGFMDMIMIYLLFVVILLAGVGAAAEYFGEERVLKFIEEHPDAFQWMAIGGATAIIAGGWSLRSYLTRRIVKAEYEREFGPLSKK
jgi:hypothetical protein